MKIRGKKLNPPSPVTVLIYRDDEEFKFVCNAVLSYSEFELSCPEPKAPLQYSAKTGAQTRDEEDPAYILRREQWGDKRIAWMCIKSLAGTEGIEWEQVSLTNPDTWHLWRKELEEFLTPSEVNRVFTGILEANSPTEKRREEALDAFSHSQSEQVVIPSPEEEHIAT